MGKKSVGKRESVFTGKKESSNLAAVAAMQGLNQLAGRPNIIAQGFVPRSAQTEAEKQRQREWDRAQLLAVKDDDAQLLIYNDLVKHQNARDAVGAGRMGLGFADGAGGGSSNYSVGMMSFVSSTASDPNDGALPAPQTAPQAPPGTASSWTICQMPEGHVYYYNNDTGVSQWEPPPPGEEAVPYAPPPPPEEECAPGTVASTGSSTSYAGSSYSYAGQDTGSGVASKAATVWLDCSGIPPEFTDQDVKDLFKTYGTVVSLQMNRGNYSTGSGTKSASVGFDLQQSADAALGLNGTRLRSHELKVKALKDKERGKPY